MVQQKLSNLDHYGLARAQTFRREKNRKQLLSVIKYLFLLVLILLGIRLIFFLPEIWGKINQPFQKIPSNLVYSSKLDFNYRTNILLGRIEGKDLREVGVASISKSDNKASILFLNPASKVYTESGSADFTNLLNLRGRMDLDPVGVAVLETLSLPLDGYLITTDKRAWVDQKDLQSLASYLYTPGFFLKSLTIKSYLDRNLRTNLSIGNLFTIASILKDGQVNYFDFTNKLSSEGFLDSEGIANRLGISVQDPLIAKEGLTVEIVNESSVGGIEDTFKKMLTTLGANVVSVSKGELTKQSTVLANNQKSKLAIRLAKLLKVDIKDLPNGNNSVDVKVILGDDFGKYFNF